MERTMETDMKIWFNVGGSHEEPFKWLSKHSMRIYARISKVRVFKTP